MPNGKPGDAPWSDFFAYGHKVFPDDIARMLRAIYGVNPKLIQHLADQDMWEWEQGRELDAARSRLSAIIEKNGIAMDDG